MGRVRKIVEGEKIGPQSAMLRWVMRSLRVQVQDMGSREDNHFMAGMKVLPQEIIMTYAAIAVFSAVANIQDSSVPTAHTHNDDAWQ